MNAAMFLRSVVAAARAGTSFFLVARIKSSILQQRFEITTELLDRPFAATTQALLDVERLIS